MIAEGIETEAELDTLRGLGIAYGQGFHLARPAELPPSPRSEVRASPTMPAQGGPRVRR